MLNSVLVCDEHFKQISAKFIHKFQTKSIQTRIYSLNSEKEVLKFMTFSFTSGIKLQ